MLGNKYLFNKNQNHDLLDLGEGKMIAISTYS